MYLETPNLSFRLKISVSISCNFRLKISASQYISQKLKLSVSRLFLVLHSANVFTEGLGFVEYSNGISRRILGWISN